jgi:hypothetical protein
MEFFGARPAKPLEVCLSELRGSELVIVIIGQLYGSIEDTVGLSFSEAEYQEAFRLGKRCLVYFRDAEVLVPPAHVEQDVKKQELLSRFKETWSGGTLWRSFAIRTISPFKSRQTSAGRSVNRRAKQHPGLTVLAAR